MAALANSSLHFGHVLPGIKSGARQPNLPSQTVQRKIIETMTNDLLRVLRARFNIRGRGRESALISSETSQTVRRPTSAATENRSSKHVLTVY
jgi:hypothetical protein